MNASTNKFTLAAQGDALLGQGRMGEAIARYRAALEADRYMPTIWYNLGWALRSERRFDEALIAYDAALETGIDAPEAVHLNKAVILSEHLYQTEAAIAESERAVQLAPGFGEGWLNLGHLFEDLGDEPGARAAYSRAAAIDRAAGSATARLARLDLRAGRKAEAIERLEPALLRTNDPSDRAELLFSLGDALDATARYGPAFEAYHAANELSAALAPRHYDAEAQERFTARMISAFPQHPAGAAQDTVPDTIAPVFICGMFRSGSTLLEHHLGRHREFQATGERELIPAFAAAIEDYPAGASAIPGPELARLRSTYLEPFRGIDRILIDKRCDNFQHIGLIKSIFPAARFINTTRSPLDNFLSIYFLGFDAGVLYANSLMQTAHYYLQYLKMMDHWKSIFPSDIHDFCYEDFVTDPASEMGRLGALLGVDLDDAGAAPPATQVRHAIRTPSAWQVRQELNTRSIGRDAHYQDQLQDVAGYLRQAGIGGYFDR